MPTNPRGFFDKLSDTVFAVIDAVFDFLESRGWNIPVETKFFFHSFIFIAIFYFTSNIIVDTFYALEVLLVALVFLTFSTANVRELRMIFGYYTSQEKIKKIVNMINNNQVSINEVVEHLNKNLLPPYLTLSIIHAFQHKENTLPPQLIRAVLRQPRSLEIVDEVIKSDLNDSDYGTMMRHYKNLLNKETLLKVIVSQKLSRSKVKDTLFYQEAAYKAIKDIAASTTENSLIDLLVLEKEAYDKRPLMKNFIRNHSFLISAAIPLLFGLIIAAIFHNLFGSLGTLVGAVSFIVLFELFHFYLIEWLYYRV